MPRTEVTESMEGSPDGDGEGTEVACGEGRGGEGKGRKERMNRLFDGGSTMGEERNYICENNYT